MGGGARGTGAGGSSAVAALAVLVALAPSRVGATPLSAVTPSPLVAGDRAETTIELRGVPGVGALQVDANVGKLGRVEEVQGTIRIRYQPPQSPFPHQLCLLLWRAGDEAPAQVARLPILARTTIPVQTRRNSQVTIRVGNRSFGPLASGPRGRLRAEVLVPPAVREALVEVVDEEGLRSHKRIAIQTPSYNELALAIAPSEGSRTSYRFTIAVANAAAGSPRLELDADLLPLSRVDAGVWTAVWAPGSAPAAARSLSASLPDRPESVRKALVEVAPTRGTAAQGPSSQAVEGASRGGRLRLNLGVGIGLMHNLGKLFSPRLSTELCLDYPLPVGRIGLRLLASFAWASQRIASEQAGVPEAESRVLLVPFGGGVVYRVPSLWLSPFAFAGLLAQLVRTSIRADYLPERLRHDWALAFLGVAGLEPRLGPGRIFLQTGYQWSRLADPELVLLGGGIVVEGGYRFEL